MVANIRNIKYKSRRDDLLITYTVIPTGFWIQSKSLFLPNGHPYGINIQL